ncbi:replication endonuclease [uncultured Pseudacidovorax sp.]|uniref:replication endonuclease n=1 Tax=uncultured Pseudacidovorax sp. TaxID=679313 RepID=UPI0025E2D15A|nr:replication endonuclease [uncultured Pseudacidovorax sp.]
MSIPGYLDRYDHVRLWTVVDSFPLSWRGRLMRALGPLRGHSYARWHAAVMKLAGADGAGLRPDASDADICAVADTTARDFARRLDLARMAARGHAMDEARGFAVHRSEWPEIYATLYARSLLDQRGMLDLYPAGPRVSRAGALRRLVSGRWWRRALRKLHARTVEACAIGLGLVGKHAGLYASDDAVKRRAGQNLRNARALESVVAVNDMGQDATLADLAAKGTANKAIRRVELLTRVAGFDLIARECGHVAYMVTMTCPSRFHKMATRAGRVVENRKHDESTPDQAQAYLSGQWAKCRAAMARMGVDWYGFRIAEPQHDGTPHWHCLLFMPRVGHSKRGPVLAERELLRTVRRYFLDNDNPNEPGAQEHRVDFERIDWAKGSAVAYVVKYVSKNIDGHGVGEDLFGNCAIESSARVEAWASTWRIRQFQQIGGAPVGVWRELRRINPEQMADGLPSPLRVAVSAVNAKGEPGLQAIAWKRYTQAQGGIGAKRKDMPLRVMGQPVAEVSQYGEERPNRITGILAQGVELFRNHVHTLCPWTPPFQRPTVAGVESERAAWVTMSGQWPRHEAIAHARRLFERSGEAASTRIHVNNCTRPDPAGSDFAPRRVYRPRLRRFPTRAGEGSTASKEPPWTNPPTPPAPRAHPTPAASP